MSTQRHPVLIWTGPTGVATAALVGDSDGAAAQARTEEEALRQLKELLEWRQEHQLGNTAPDFAEPVLTKVKVEVRPQYREGERVLPYPETLWLHVPCVTGRQENGLRVAAVPHLRLGFNYQDAAALNSLVAHFVKEALHELTPMQLARRLPPRHCRLEEIVLREKPERERQVLPEHRPELKVLFVVADPLLGEAGRQKKSPAAFGRENLVYHLTEKLAREKSNLLLVGPAGVGKSTVLVDAVRGWWRRKPEATAAGEESEAAQDLRKYRVWRGSAGRLIAGMRYLGEWEERCEAFLRQLATIEGVFCAENLLELVQVGGRGAGDSVGSFLLPYLQRGELRMVAEATPEEVEACRRLLPGLLDVFQVVPVPVFSEPEAAAVLSRLAETYATSARKETEPAVPALVHRLFQRFQPYAVFPGPAARFLRGLHDHPSSAKTVTTQEALAAFVKLTGLPEKFLRDDLPLDWEEVREELAAKVIGQAEAVSAAAGVIITLKAGLGDPARPFGVMLFCGPTGVGKTELVRTLAGYCFGAGGAKDRLVRLDMSEYGGWGAAQRLLESPDGAPAAWIARVRQQPFCVVLFDEIEKAAPEVFDVLLGLLDEGRLTDRFGRVTQFRSAIIVMTSNLGASAGRTAGFQAGAGPDYESEAAKYFRPEFFNRLDAVVTFRPLSAADVGAIVRKELAELARREGFASAHIRLEWSEELVAAVARLGYDPRYGARPLQRALEQTVSTPLARWKSANPAVRQVTIHVGLVPGEGVRLEVKPDNSHSGGIDLLVR
jgi:ATP-dependent Clp protease ATP-binding subunit ClpC